MIRMATFEVKNKLSEALRLVEQGQTVVITRRGKAIADIRPHKQEKQKSSLKVLRAFPHAGGLKTKRNTSSSREVDL
ncbi:MAG: type II toxin-antitoxin system prevent-host-death family antitoxin [Candidatus Omnitrophica bacterium]|nr:type II toxin-antitoxin system prevent-host-death family antitoxin [Candidatus Omnitrophota bacterium]